MTRIDYFKFLTKLLDKHELTLSVDEVGSRIYNCILRGNSILIFENGDSASTAKHLETDMSFIKHEDLTTEISRIKQESSWTPRYSIAEGVESFVNGAKTVKLS